MKKIIFILMVIFSLFSCGRHSVDKYDITLVTCDQEKMSSVTINCSEVNPPVISWSKKCDLEYYTLDINNGQTNANLLHTAIDKGATSYTVDQKVVELMTADTTTQSVEYKVVLTLSVDNTDYPIEKKCTLDKGSTGQGAGGGSDDVPPVIDDIYTTKEVSIRVDNKYFITAEGGGGQDVNADRAIAKEWEKFTLLQYEDGRASFKTEQSYYLTVTDNGEIKASAKTLSEKEYFTLTYINNSSTDVNIKAYNGKYVCSDRDKGWKLYANRDVAKEWEVFKIENYKYGNGEGVDPSSPIGEPSPTTVGLKPLINFENFKEPEKYNSVGGPGGNQFEYNCPPNQIAVGAIFYKKDPLSLFGIRLICEPIGTKKDENSIELPSGETQSPVYGKSMAPLEELKALCPDFKEGDVVKGQGYLRGFSGFYGNNGYGKGEKGEDNGLPSATGVVVIKEIQVLCGYINPSGILSSWQGGSSANAYGTCTVKNGCKMPESGPFPETSLIHSFDNSLITGIHGAAGNRVDSIGVFFRGKK